MNTTQLVIPFVIALILFGPRSVFGPPRFALSPNRSRLHDASGSLSYAGGFPPLEALETLRPELDSCISEPKITVPVRLVESIAVVNRTCSVAKSLLIAALWIRNDGRQQKPVARRAKFRRQPVTSHNLAEVIHLFSSRF